MRTKKLMASISVTASLFVVMSGCNKTDVDSKTFPEEDTFSTENITTTIEEAEEEYCESSYWDEETKTWICDESGSPHYGYHYYNQTYYPNAALLQNAAYRQYRASSAFLQATANNTAKPLGRTVPQGNPASNIGKRTSVSPETGQNRNVTPTSPNTSKPTGGFGSGTNSSGGG